MYRVPAQPKIYHILHVDRLASVMAAGGLWCDAEMQQRGGGGTTIGMSKLKNDRLHERRVKCHEGDYVGHYVPFYFCPRSVMLFMIYKANHEDLTYLGGQKPIIHLEADLYRTVMWAEENNKRWAFSLANASAAYTEFRARLDQLNEINWSAVNAHHWQPPDIKESKQAEFLLHSFFPWELVEQIGVATQEIGQQVVQIMQANDHRPTVSRKTNWYY
jgi:ssDNA thymidine ADP-ribosyltransferase, DarT